MYTYIVLSYVVCIHVIKYSSKQRPSLYLALVQMLYMCTSILFYFYLPVFYFTLHSHVENVHLYSDSIC